MRDKVERERITVELNLERERIEASKARETLDVQRQQALDAAQLERRRTIELLEVARMQALRESEVAFNEQVEQRRIEAERALDEARIDQERQRRVKEVERDLAIEGSLMDKAISLYQKSLEELAAQAKADLARVKVAEAEEQVTTARETEQANRRRAVDVTLAEKAAEEARIAAEAQAIRTAVEAEGQRLLNEAENVLTDEARYSLFRRKLLEHIEGIVAASVKPMEKINDIRIMQLDGLGGGGSGSGERKNATDEVIDSALRYRVQAPMVDSLLADIGIEGGNLSKMGGLIREARDMTAIAKDVGQGKGDTKGPAASGDASGGGDKPDAPAKRK
ncbi:MAG: flotillin domain-containing protein [Burkholderiaceae bacterium]